MPRLLFEKKNNAVWISHLDLMRVFQRAFKRAKLPLKHTQGFNPRPSVSIALPLSVGVESNCELLDFELVDCQVADSEIKQRLNEKLISGIHVLDVYNDGRKTGLISLLQCQIVLEYDSAIEKSTLEKIRDLFLRTDVIVEKKTKSGPQDQNIIPMIRRLEAVQTGEHAISLDALVCCQNPTLNPAQIVAAINKYLPECTPDSSRCKRIEIYDSVENVFR